MFFSGICFLGSFGKAHVLLSTWSCSCWNFQHATCQQTSHIVSEGPELQKVSALSSAQCELNAAHQTSIFFLCWKKVRWKFINRVYLNSETGKNGTSSWSWGLQVLKPSHCLSYVNQNYSSVCLVISLGCETKFVLHIREIAFQWQTNDLLLFIRKKTPKHVGKWGQQKEKVVQLLCIFFYIEDLYFYFLNNAWNCLVSIKAHLHD